MRLGEREGAVDLAVHSRGSNTDSARAGLTTYVFNTLSPMPVIWGRTSEERRGRRSCLRDRRTGTSISRGKEERMFQAELYFSVNAAAETHLIFISGIGDSTTQLFITRVYYNLPRIAQL